ncbi:hypothetical protein [Kordia sp.]|uniref:hypothetical protein n=1 Tax=Kordia sp. TaxID=1965332 RepID=UPI0025C5338B|nr:hypothetical protein [Kordia sp.]MCH2197113.1 hypothetical protein [Kordia sp.]MCH2232195.1 hypothetical protein [Crocinitomicaceae bacterium]
MPTLEERVAALEAELSNRQEATTSTVVTEFDENLHHLAIDASDETLKQIPANLLSNFLGFGVNIPYESNIIKKASTSSSNLFGGTEQQPNYIGIELHVQHYQGDGTTSTYNITAPFVINNLPTVNARAIIKRPSDGTILAYSDGNGFTVNSGYGTNTINITFNTPPVEGSLVEFTVFGENEDPEANVFLIDTSGYDNSVNAIASKVNSHHSIVFKGNGHNTIEGGSYIRQWGSFHFATGTGIWIGRNNNDSFNCVGLGKGLEVDGNNSGAIGTNLKVNGNGCLWIGRDSIIGSEVDAKEDSVGFGRRGECFHNGALVLSGGKSTDEKNGLYQNCRIVLGANTTNVSSVFMSATDGTNSIILPENSAYTVTVSVIAWKDDFSKSESYNGTYNLVVDSNGISRVNGSTADVSIPSIGNFGSASYSSYIRALANKKVGIKVVGVANENIRWSATLDFTQTRY